MRGSGLLEVPLPPLCLSWQKNIGLRWVTTCLTTKPTESSAPKYADWEACASVFVAVDILTHHDYPALRTRRTKLLRSEGSSGPGRLRFKAPLRVPPTDLQIDMDILVNVVESFSFSEVRKRSLAQRFCFVLCENGNDKDTLANYGGIILLMGQISLYVYFAPTMDDTIRTSLPKEVRIALRSHNAIFYHGGLCSQRDILDFDATGGPLQNYDANHVMSRSV